MTGRREILVVVASVLVEESVVESVGGLVELDFCLGLLVTLDVGWREDRCHVLSLTADTEPTNLLSKTGCIGLWSF
jgi:hypothetical protein